MFAIEALATLATQMSNHNSYDIRLETTTAKK